MQYLGYCKVCNSINLDRQFNLMLINLTPYIRHLGDLRDSLLPFHSLFFLKFGPTEDKKMEKGKAKVNHGDRQDVLYEVSNL